MKVFSMILTTLFLLSFTSMAFAEPEYTITNKSNATVSIHLNKPHEGARNSFSLKPHQCAKLTESQFYNLDFIFVQSRVSTFTMFCDEELECEPGNYEVRMKSFLDVLLSDNRYTLTAVNRANTDICQHLR